LLIGVIITAIMFRGGQGRTPFGQRVPMGEVVAISKVSEKFQPIVDKIWKNHLSSQRVKFKEIFSLRREVKAFLLEESLNPVKIKETIKKMHALEDTVRVNNIESMVEVALKLPLKEREKYFSRMRLAPQDAPGPRGHNAPPPRDPGRFN